MHSSTFVSALMALGFASANYVNTTTPTAGPTGGDVIVTETVTALTTYCPSATEITTNGKTYTVTSATTLTITDCPCTIKKTSAAPTTTTVAAPTKNSTIIYTTEVVPVYTTYCPAPTTITQGTKTYTVTAPTTLTITDCPCTISHPIGTLPPSTSAAPVYTAPSAAPPQPYTNATVIYTTEVVSTLTTYCPTPTTLTVGTNTYPVTAPTTLTISEGCPCTVTKPVTTAPYTAPAAVSTSAAVHTPVAPPATPTTVAVSTKASAVPVGSATIATGGAGSVGASLMAWVAAAAFAVAA